VLPLVLPERAKICRFAGSFDSCRALTAAWLRGTRMVRRSAVREGQKCIPRPGPVLDRDVTEPGNEPVPRGTSEAAIWTPMPLTASSR
jgi:hypothetical protein